MTSLSAHPLGTLRQHLPEVNGCSNCLLGKRLTGHSTGAREAKSYGVLQCSVRARSTLSLDVQIQEEGPVPQLREHMMVAQDGQILPHIQQEESDMAAYIIGLRRSEPRGTAWLEEYLPKTAALIAKHGGKVVIGGNAPQALMALEGEAKPPLSVVVLAFPRSSTPKPFTTTRPTRR